MRGRYLTGLVCGVALLTGCGGSVSTLKANLGYTATMIGPLPANNFVTHAFSINGKGQVAGGIQNSQTQLRLPFVWSRSGGLKLLPLPAGIPGGDAWGMNDSGTVVGWGYVSGQNTHGLVWDPNGTVHDIGTLAGNLTNLQTISNNGVAVGFSVAGDGHVHPISWSESKGITDLAPEVGVGATVYGINDSGTIVGTELNNGVQEAFVYTPAGGFQWLGVFSGTSSTAESVTDDNFVTGQVVFGLTAVDPFFWTPSSGGHLLADAPQAVRAQVVPVHTSSTEALVGGGTEAFVWTPQHGFQLLTPLTTGLPKGVSMNDGEGINSSGQIVGWASDKNWYCLSPRQP